MCWCWPITGRGRSPNGRSTLAAQLSTIMSCPPTTSTVRTCRSMARIDRSKTYNKSIVVVAAAATAGGGGGGGGGSAIDLAFYVKKGSRSFLFPRLFFFSALTHFILSFYLFVSVKDVAFVVSEVAQCRRICFYFCYLLFCYLSCYLF